MEATSDIVSPASSPEKSSVKPLQGEALNLDLECLLVTLEAGSGSTSIPLVKFQASSHISAEGFFGKKVFIEILKFLQLISIVLNVIKDFIVNIKMHGRDCWF